MKPAENILRHFDDVDDLFDNVDSATILKWINAYAEKEDARKTYQRKYQNKRALALKTMRAMLDRDELARIEELAREAATERLIGGINGNKEDEEDLE